MAIYHLEAKEFLHGRLLMQEYFIITSYQSVQRQQPVDQRLILTNELIASAENQSEKQEHLPLQTTGIV